jgi:hypothetical protein
MPAWPEDEARAITVQQGRAYRHAALVMPLSINPLAQPGPLTGVSDLKQGAASIRGSPFPRQPSRCKSLAEEHEVEQGFKSCRQLPT